MNFGILQRVGTPQEVYGDPANTFVATFLGTPPMNLVERANSTVGFRPEHFHPQETFRDQIAVAKAPAGPTRRVTSAPLLASTIWKFSQAQDLARQFLLDWTSNFTPNFIASTGYNQPANTGFVEDPMPILSNDEGSNP